jgi:rfaE bifunctional protein kinase chain/domain
MAQPSMVTSERINQILSKASGQRTLVLGDMVVDEHIIGEARHIAREAPIPVIDQQARLVVPGGATNVATNLKSLGCNVSVAGIVGADDMGDRLRDELEQRGISTVGLLKEANRSTSVKLRLWAGGDRQRPQSMVARIDHVDRAPFSASTTRQLSDYLREAMSQTDGFLVSDYDAGAVNDEALRTALPAALAAGIIVTADAHGNLGRFSDTTLLTPNQPEAEAELGRKITSSATALAAADELRRSIGVEIVLLTLGEAGMALQTVEGDALLIPSSESIGVADPTGAGDTVAACMTAALLGGATSIEAAQISMLAAQVVIRKLGAAVVTNTDLQQEANAQAG